MPALRNSVRGRRKSRRRGPEDRGKIDIQEKEKERDVSPRKRKKAARSAIQNSFGEEGNLIKQVIEKMRSGKRFTEVLGKSGMA